MRKVNFFFNLKPFSENLKKESIEAVKEVAERMMECLETFGERIVDQKKKFWQTIDYKLVRPAVSKINSFEFWLENNGVMEIPDVILKEYLYLMALVDDSKFIDVDKAEESISITNEPIVVEDNEQKEANIDSLIADINSTITQTRVILLEVEKFGKILEQKKTQLNTRIKGQQIVEVFSPVIDDLKIKYEHIKSEGTMESFQKLINEFCSALEERNELRYRLVHGEDRIEIPDSADKNELNQDVSIDQNVNIDSNNSQNQIIDSVNSIQEKSKRYTSVVDKNAMKLFARWSLPNHPG
ncbi:hypothetical protein [Cryptosporidium parvum Iowa II]|uniref:Uncharacterized protein n=2 Tax=Cryptosporidium parvum TaxID=5807 RepID=Q5CY29_CRYPI|nr:hypothetical protein [Cryptosporidium parvum Iowa II]EAK90382.1 hypothetical protein cgd7_3900 [Cryptosporidium parvum Iowa II]QOY40711.1 Uncharacterized protein CPATCC_0009740 [Cryptosporidium parvum]WKS79080.1 hypothetical protein CPCDC_7g3900 [Cryptosporidium sp. 43IA8]WRK33567.1 Uncharacterized protein cpbgf_7003900 [Cryptosporidium parvum]|eukprot:QOY40711.1 hypothetical protein CPATCC_003596 [Cryptosporidium parvum]